MAMQPKVTAVETALARRRRLTWPLFGVAVLIFLIGLVTVVLGAVVLSRFTGDATPYYADIEDHFKYGSIGSEPESGLPYAVWQALPALFPDQFGENGDYAAFGFLYESDADGSRHDLPVGVSRRQVNGVDVVWLNCAICHTGTVNATGDGGRRIVVAMPANNLDLYRFSRFVLSLAGNERMSPDVLIPAMEDSGADFDWLDRLFWRLAVLPRVREGLVQRHARLTPLLDAQTPWGPGRVDTFNPYKLLVFGKTIDDIAPAERAGAADFPSIFHQGPRGEQDMELHWDGNNPSLQERNLSAAIGAGVTEETVDHASIERVADWLLDLAPPPSTHEVDARRAAEGRALYMTHCAACHGYQSDEGYVFEGERLGKVETIGQIATDPGRLDSYTAELRDNQMTLFADDPRYRFRHFRKTDGYANQPLDGLWLRAPYLHNGAVSTLADLLQPPRQRPVAFVRGLDDLDGGQGGFTAPPCDPATYHGPGFCFDTRLPGNANSGHLYGTELPDTDKAALLEYLKSF